MKKRILALWLAVTLLLTTGIGTTVFATDDGDSGDTAIGESCNHAHNDTCGYVEAKDAVPCAVEEAHAHDDACGYTAATAGQPCTHGHDNDCGGLALGQSGGPATPTNAVTFTMPENEYGEAVFYLPEGVPVTEADLLAGVSAADGTGADVLVTVQDAGGLNLANPVPGGEGFPPQPYTITYAAAHPESGEVFTATRNCYVTVGVVPLADINSYASLLTECANTSGDNVVKLTGNITNGNSQFTIGRTLTLDLNGHSLTITVDGYNGIKIASGVTLTIMDSSNPGTGKLAVTNRMTMIKTGEGAGINVTEGTLIIQSGTIDVKGGNAGAGIGGGLGDGGGIITINGGNITVVGGSYAHSGAGIGGGSGGDGGNITINGGDIIAAGGDIITTGGDGVGAGIGGGENGAGGNITITGGNITATGGTYGGAGIGGGDKGAGGTITISGGDIIATGRMSGSAGIGGGGASGDITIGGNANVTATGGSGYGVGFGAGGGAGIGSSGERGGGTGSGPGSVGNIVINTTGTVTATGGAGINNGGYGTGGTGAAIGAGGGAGTSGGINGADGVPEILIITATAGIGGSISPGGQAFVALSGNQTFTITPDAGYEIAQVLVDGVNDTTAVSSGSYTFTGVTADHTIEAVFIANPALALAASPAGELTLPGSVVLTATLSGAFSGDHSGKTITFTVDGATHTATTNASGIATYTLASPGAGTYSFGASFAGDAQNNAAAATDITGYIVNPPVPVLSANPTSLAFGALPVNATGTKTVTISGSYLTGNVTYGITGDTSAFSVAETSWNAASGGTLQVTFKPTAATAYNATLTFSSPGAANVTVSLTGGKTRGGTDSGSDSGSDPTPAYTQRTLQHSGVTLTGRFTIGASLVVTENALHTKGSCDACDWIRTQWAAGELITLRDIFLSGDYIGGLDLSIPVGSEYDGQTLTVLHCRNRTLEQREIVVKDGAVTGNFASLSPFAVLKPAQTPAVSPPDNHNPNTGMPSPQAGNMGLWIEILAVPLLAGALTVFRRARR